MPTVDIYNQEGKKVEKIELNPAIFAATVNPKLMAQAVRVRLINARLGTRKTKSRGEVRGGGRKPWRQKGTGRARHGSRRSPIWVGGGHAHPLRPNNYSLKIPSKMRRLALFSALTQKNKQKCLLIVDKIDLKKVSTKSVSEILKKLPVAEKVMLVLPKKERKIELSVKNLPKKKTLEARLLNVYDVLNYETILILRDSLEVVEKTFLKNGK